VSFDETLTNTQVLFWVIETAAALPLILSQRQKIRYVESEKATFMATAFTYPQNKKRLIFTSSK